VSGDCSLRSFRCAEDLSFSCCVHRVNLPRKQAVKCTVRAVEYTNLCGVLQIYLRICGKSDCSSDVLLNLACCCFYLGLYTEAKDAADMGESRNVLIVSLWFAVQLQYVLVLFSAPDCGLKRRLKFHLCYKVHDMSPLFFALVLCVCFTSRFSS